eukprot:gene9820-9978_t
MSEEAGPAGSLAEAAADVGSDVSNLSADDAGLGTESDSHADVSDDEDGSDGDDQASEEQGSEEYDKSSGGEDGQSSGSEDDEADDTAAAAAGEQEKLGGSSSGEDAGAVDDEADEDFDATNESLMERLKGAQQWAVQGGPLKSLRELLHSGERLGVETDATEALRARIRRREWEEAARKVATGRATINSLAGKRGVGGC